MPTDFNFLQYGALGLLAAVLATLAHGLWKASKFAYFDLVKPLALRHIEFTEAIEASTKEMVQANKSQDASTKEMVDANKKLVEANNIQIGLLKEVRDKQTQMCRWVPSVNGREG